MAEHSNHILVALNAAGEESAMMYVDGDSCREVARTLLEWHEVDPRRRLTIRPNAIALRAALKQES